MITFLTLLFVIIVVAVLALFALGAGGAVLLVVFGDVIIGGVLIYFIVRTITRKK